MKGKQNHRFLRVGIRSAVTMFLMANISSIACATPRNTVVREVKYKDQPSDIICSPDGKFVYMADYSGVISVIDAQNNRRTGSRLEIGTKQPSLAISPDSKMLYAGAYLTPPYYALDFISTATLSLVTQVQLEYGWEFIALTPDGKEVWVPASNNGIYVVDTATHQVAPNQISVPGGPGSLVFTPDGTQCYVCYFPSNSKNGFLTRLALIDTASRTVINDNVAGRELHSGNLQGPVFLAVNPVRNEIYALVNTTDAVSNVIVVISTTDNRARKLYVPASPKGTAQSLCATPNGKFLYCGLDNFPDTPLFQVVSIGATYGKSCGQPLDGFIASEIAIRPDSKYAYLLGTDFSGSNNIVEIVDIGPTDTETPGGPAPDLPAIP